MDLAGLAALIDALAWPVAFFGAVVILRRPLFDLMERAKSVDVKGIKVELREKLEQARASAEDAAMTIAFSARSLRQPPTSADGLPPRSDGPFAGTTSAPASPTGAARGASLADEATQFYVSPSDARHGALSATDNPGLFLASLFDDLSGRLRTAAKTIGGASVGYHDALDLLESREVLTANMRTVIERLHDARNIAVHGDDSTITPAEAAEWAGITRGLIQRIDQRTRMLNEGKPPPARP